MKAPSALLSLSNVFLSRLFLPFQHWPTSIKKASHLTHVHLMTEQQAPVQSATCSSGSPGSLRVHVAADLMPTQALV